uniref:Uncharacterized protein n=1 Tax=Glycine max TaxID=3847 RepID=A0A0R0IDS7_SOYBN
MPASPSENQTRWRKRKRDSQISRRHQKHEEEEEEEDDDDDDENPNGATRSTIRRTKRTTTTVIRNLTWRRRSSPTTTFRCRSSLIKRSVHRPHSSVTAFVALERALESGENKARSALEHKPPPSNNGLKFQSFLLN